MKLGDMIRDLRNPNLSKQRLDDIVRQLNEFGDREERYKAMLQSASGNPTLFSPIISNPEFVTAPLQPLELVKTTTKSTSTSVDYYVEFDTIYGKSNYFHLDKTDNTIIHAAYPGVNMCAIGHAIWASNATGFRAISGQYYDNQGASLGTINWAGLPPVNGSSTVTPFGFADLLSASPNIAYFRVKVNQNSGGALDLTAFQMTVFHI